MRHVLQKRKGFTLIELLVVVAIIALLISILLPSLARARELSKRGVCAANLKGMGTSFATYGNENGDTYPIATQWQTAASATVTGHVYTQAIGSHRGSLANPNQGNPDSSTYTGQSGKLSVARNLWTLVRMNMSSTKSFICPSTDDSPNNDDSPQNFWDFGQSVNGNPDNTSDISGSDDPKNGYSQVSYGYQIPYGKLGKPIGDRGSNIAIAADRGPYVAALDGGKGDSPGVPGLASTATPDEWYRYNSPNHGGFGAGEGQVVLYGDAHAEFQNKASCGQGFDNIYTSWTNTTSTAIGDRIGGKVPSANEAPMHDDDSFIY